MRSPLAAASTALALSLVASSATAQTMPPQQDMELARSIFSELIEINTVNSELGNNTTAALAMQRRLLDAGFPEEDVHVLVPEGFPSKGNLVARYRGRDTGKKPILLLAHLDVVEALPEDWSLDLNPFEFIESDGYYYGRGITDDKDEATIHIANFIRWRREGFVPDRDLIVALTADEEGGRRNGVGFLLAEYRDLIDAAFAFNEGGGGMEKDGKKISNDRATDLNLTKNHLIFQFSQLPNSLIQRYKSLNRELFKSQYRDLFVNKTQKPFSCDRFNGLYSNKKYFYIKTVFKIE